MYYLMRACKDENNGLFNIMKRSDDKHKIISELKWLIEAGVGGENLYVFEEKLFAVTVSIVELKEAANEPK